MSPRQTPTVAALSQFTERPDNRALIDHFCNVFSHLIVLREETGNPFLELVLPLSSAGSPILNVIYAISSAHLEYRGVRSVEKSLHYHSQAIEGLTRLIGENNRSKKAELLATVVLLIYYEAVSNLTLLL